MLAELPAENFEKFFTALWGEDKAPFAWQKELAKRVLEHSECTAARSQNPDASCDAKGAGKSPWPEVIALPTASGKTVCMDIAVFALAAQAPRLDTGNPITAPRRIFFVVDRRIIVDEAYERARRLAEKLDKAEEGILKTVADNLRCIAHGETAGFKDKDKRPLAFHALRGGIFRSEAWARNPLQPTIVASTVDQIGSRLLFRAYGRGAGTWPVYAGLVANDSLILLDEAHCAQPFLQTLHAVERFRMWADAPLERCFHPVVMSATPPRGMADVFKDSSLEGAEPNHPLGRRQMARKPAALVCVAKARGDNAIMELSKELAKSAQRLLNGEWRAIVVFVNRVATARETSGLLREERNDVDVVLLTGRMRPVDKDAVVERLRQLDLSSERSPGRSLERSVIVVATQTLEVGADLDFDGLVTECASLDALRQRFGRLNRIGRRIEARAEIIIRSDQAKPKRGEEDDPVYGRALTETWKWLDEHKDGNNEVDFGIAPLDSLLPEDDSLAKLNAPSVNAPVMLPAHVDCWAQTAPEPCPSPDVALFLHGPREGAADLQVCWRADLDLSDEAAQQYALESLTLCPPSSGEMLPVPIGVFKRWLAGTGESEDHSADVEGAGVGPWEEDKYEDDLNIAGRCVVRWRGAKTSSEDIISKPANIRPGDVIVIPTAPYGSWRQLGDLPSAAVETPETLDMGDPAHRIARGKPVLRLHRNIVSAWPDSMTAKATALSLLDDLEQRYEEDPDEVTHAVQDILTKLSTADALPDRWAWLPKAAQELKAEFSTVALLRRGCRLAGSRSLILAGRRLVPELAHEADSFSDEDDSSASGISHRDGKPVLLRTHLPGVEFFARQHAVGCGLSRELVEAVARAGLLHDVGKADPRFQSLLRGGSPLADSDILAKSARMPKTQAMRQRACEDSGYPRGGRHELLSVRLAESVPALLPEDDDLRDLVLHLVASHHGYCRPFAPVVSDDKELPVEYELHGHRLWWRGPTRLERLDSGTADRYWRLTQRHGWWGLAWLEALLRLADWRRSEWEERHDACE